MFDACPQENGLEKLLIERWYVSVLPPIGGQPLLHFVRPALEQFYRTFYGNHTFSDWLVQQQVTVEGPVFKLVDFDGADLVDALPMHQGGIYDL